MPSKLSKSSKAPKNLRFAARIAFLAAVCSVPAFPAWSDSDVRRGETNVVQDQLYSVSKVLSGDSFQLDTGAVISYASALAPDLMSPTKRIENYAVESLEFNRKLLESRKVRLEWGSRIRNPKGHYLAYVFLEDGTFANWKVLDAGFAKLRIEPPNLEHADELRDAARDARRDAKGLWQYEKDNPARQVSFVGDNMTRRFHYSDCPELEDVPQGHRRNLASAVDATSQDLRWCPVCKNAVEQHTELF